MDMWKAFRNSTRKEGHAPQALIIFDKFHVLRHLQEALDQVRKSEYRRLTGPGRRFIKGQKFALLSRWRNLTYTGKKALKLLFHANKRLHTAYLLKESFEQLWDYEQPGWARRFFDNWRASLKWQRLKPYEKFAAMIAKHWDGIVSYCQASNKVALGFVEGLIVRHLPLRPAVGLQDRDTTLAGRRLAPVLRMAPVAREPCPPVRTERVARETGAAAGRERDHPGRAHLGSHAHAIGATAYGPGESGQDLSLPDLLAVTRSVMTTVACLSPSVSGLAWDN
jgi:hypothetical protein